MKLTKFANMQIIVDFQEFSASTKFGEYVISFAYLLIHLTLFYTGGGIYAPPPSILFITTLEILALQS